MSSRHLHDAQRPPEGRSALWDQVVRAGRDLAVRLSSQERSIRNARTATTVLSRARVERDAVELYLADHEEQRAAEAAEAESVLPRQREGEPDQRDAVGQNGS